MTKDQIKHMVDRFLFWKLPENFNPDGGISFKKMFNEHTDHPMKHAPSGTNLLDAIQAEAMVRYMVEGLPSATTKPFSTYPEDRERLLALCAKIENDRDNETVIEAAYALADLVKVILTDEKVADETAIRHESPATENLRTYQRQLDMDGSEK